MQYAEGGSLRQYLNNKSHNLDWNKKFSILDSILKGLNDIHDAGLIHRDLHSGNVVLFNSGNACITDFGFCRSINYDLSNENQVYGVVPYVAPEVLCRHEYTQSADIYSFGILLNEVATGIPPHHNYPHDIILASKIIEGFRPMIDYKITPPCIIQLIQRCWNADPKVRPTARELKDQFDTFNFSGFQIQLEPMPSNFQAIKSPEDFTDSGVIDLHIPNS
ncbi:16300_t:CDS:2, partial [Cetraspora pellucida]